MPAKVTISRPDVVAMIEAAAQRFANGDVTEAVALAMRRFQDAHERSGSLFGAHKGSVAVAEGVDLTAPVLRDATDTP
jgi:hypothetical protein